MYKIPNGPRSRVSESGITHLEHPAGQVFVFKRRDDDVITRKLTDTENLSGNLRLRGAMFSHHMPWGYNALFQGFGAEIEGVDLDVIRVTGKGIYPDLSA